MESRSDPAAGAASTLARPPDLPRSWDDVRLQKLWLATQRREWRSIAILGASKSLDTLPIADLFAKLAWWYRGQPSCVFDLRDLSLRLVEHHVREARTQADEGSCVVIALRSIFENPAAAPIARSADAVVLCVGLGSTDFRAVERTLSEIGSERVLGSIVIRPPHAR
jgi:hypothetical protein